MSKTEEIARLAYELWENEGRPAGKDFIHWLEAEARVNGKKSRVKKVAKPKSKQTPTKRKSR